jgi:hypothetical protein
VTNLITPPEPRATLQHREPTYRRIQREHGETPPRSDTEALANIGRVFPKVRIPKGGSS